MRETTAGDIMVPVTSYPRVAPGTTLREAILEIQSSHEDGSGQARLPRQLLVMEGGRLLGIVRRRDILRALEPDYASHRPEGDQRKRFDARFDPNLLEAIADRIPDIVRDHARRTVGGIVRPVEATVQRRDHLLKLIHVMVESDLPLLPVLEDGEVVGVVRTIDVCREVARILA